MKNLNERIKNYFEENKNEYNQLVSERMSYDGWHQEDEIYDMIELYDCYRLDSRADFNTLMNHIFLGHDESSGPESSFNPNRDYFYFNNYGRLVSTDCRDYSDFIEEMVDDIINGELEYEGYFTVPEEVKEMLEEYNDEKEGTENEGTN